MLTACGLLSASLLAGTVAGTPNALAAITFTKTVDKANPAPGENVTYTLSYTCSQTDCENGKITDALPAGMEFVGWTPDATTVDVDNSTVPAAGAKGGTMDIALNPLTPGTTATVKVTLKFPNFTTANGTQAVNSAVFTADGETPQTGTATTTAVVQPKYKVTKGVQTSSQDGRTVTYQFSTCSTDGVPNVDLDVTKLIDKLPAGAVVDTSRSPGWADDGSGTNTWQYDVGPFVSGNGQAGCRNPGVLVVNFPDPTFPTGSTATNSVTLNGDPLGPDGARDLDTATAVSPTFQDPSTGVKISSAKVWQSKFVSGDIGSFSLFPTNVSVPITSLVMTDPGTDTTTDLYNWLAPQSIQLEAWNPTSIGLTFEYRLNGDPAWQTFTPGTPFNGAAARRLTFATGAGDPANDIVGIPAGRWLHGLRFSWAGPIPTGWSPGSSVQVLAQVLYTGHDGATAPTPLHNCVTVVGTDGSTTDTATACADTTVTAATNLGAAKTTVAGAVLAPGGEATFQVIPYNRTGRTLDKPLVLYDLLPPGMVYVDGSVRPDPAWTDAKGPQEVVVLPGKNGRQLIRMTWPAGSPDMMYLHDNLAYRVLFEAEAAGSAQPGTLTNDVYVTADGASPPVTCMFYGTDSSVPDTDDFNENGNTTEKLCHASSKVEIQVPAVLRAFKEVKGDEDADYGSSATTSPGGQISYRMTVRNDSPDAVTDFVAYDRLPTPGDGYVLRPETPRGSAWTPSLTEPIVSSDPTVVVEYSTVPNPCRPVSLGGPAGCALAAEWSTTFPGPGLATWFRISRPGTLASGGLFTLTWPMVASYDAPESAFAWNSFAYTATDNSGAQLLPAEPAKVGVGVHQKVKPANSIGDLVWNDLNKNGLQDPGEPYVGGVTAFLLDGKGRKIRDRNGKPATSTSTGRGYYIFLHVPDGTYAVQFDLSTIPAGATVTVKDAVRRTAASAEDSDADPVTGITENVTVAGGEAQLNLDLGLILPPEPTPSPSPTPTPEPTPPTPTVPASPTASATGGLPDTGSDFPAAFFAVLALALAAAGAVLGLTSRQRGRRS
ncbi:putative repeat protein (TIGR01451 family) [Kitasatospora gansuensis]|uniref:Putative repeat protein (TIGR01451 family) n=1 Tax=Kitasatospora gansuensis TaxID=258050 RepID=A0A7W7SCB3_9ACTN|nr:SdrD B-like domain-containing protein [Kitasatospora gansuensis]MBB4947422.1 putative repeat protein (TIGR01451 family) [Kitasatospora gansuensis]